MYLFLQMKFYFKGETIKKQFAKLFNRQTKIYFQKVFRAINPKILHCAVKTLEKFSIDTLKSLSITVTRCTCPFCGIKLNDTFEGYNLYVFYKDFI